MNKDSSNSLGKLGTNHQMLASVFRRSIEEWGDDPRASKEEKNAFISIDVRLLMKLFFFIPSIIFFIKMTVKKP